MSRITVLLTGGGGTAIPFVIEQLRTRGCRVLAADMDSLAPGLLLADAGFVIPAARDPTFLPVLRRVCSDEKVNVLVPLVDEELVGAATLESPDLQVLLPRPAFIELALDKLALARALADAGLPAPVTRLAVEGPADMSFPLVLKPRTGRGSRGVKFLDCRADWEAARLHTPGLESYILQECIQGPEYTVSVMVWRDGVVQAVVPKLIVDKRGVTRQAVTRRVESIEQVAGDVQRRFHADGPFNMQLRMCSRTGRPTLFEINPRFSTSVTLTHAAGVDEVGLLVEQALGRRNSSVLPWREGVVLLRTTRDVFLDDVEWRSRQPRHLENKS